MRALYNILLSMPVVLAMLPMRAVSMGDASMVADQADTLRLPDTSYQSVAKFKYVVDVFQADTVALIEDLSDQYSSAPGYLTFRGSPLRDAPFTGKVQGRPADIAIDWKFKTAYCADSTAWGVWGGGSGWTGQPLYVHWPDSVAERFKTSGSVLTDFGPEEIFIGSLAKQLYCLNYNTGKLSRNPFPTRLPVKGTVSLDPSLNGRLYAGQAVPMGGEFGAFIFDLNTHTQFSYFNRDPKAWRYWGAYDSSPVAVGRFMIRPGENGTIYKIERFADTFTIHSAMRYRDAAGQAPGMESSMAVYRNYGYVADNRGNLLCVNLDNLKPVWAYSMGDDTDSTPVIAVEEGRPVVYAASELDKQGSAGNAAMVKLDALNGNLIWRKNIPCRKFQWAEKAREGGFFATPLLGRANCAELIFCNVCFPVTSPNAGEFIAFNRSTGDVVYRKKLDMYAWSSPVAFVDDSGNMYAFTGDIRGNAYVFDAKSGEQLVKKHIGMNFESSPVVIDSCLVLGSRGTDIFKMHLTLKKQTKR